MCCIMLMYSIFYDYIWYYKWLLHAWLSYLNEHEWNQLPIIFKIFIMSIAIKFKQTLLKIQKFMGILVL